MPTLTSKQKIAQVYLSLVPFAATFLAFASGHVSYKIYLPIWIINACLMITATWLLGAHVLKNKDVEKKHIAIAACFLLIPTMLTAIFGGMGAPPNTIQEWIMMATEQQIRFSFLIASGIAIAFGLTLLKEKLTKTAGSVYAQLGFVAIIIALPLLIINMCFWHSFALETYKIKQASALAKSPDWFLPVRNQIWVLSVVEVSLTYFAIAVFAAAIYAAGWFSKTPACVYIVISTIAISCILLQPLYPGSTLFSGFPYYPFMIPAIPFFLIYFIGINLLRRVGKDVGAAVKH